MVYFLPASFFYCSETQNGPSLQSASFTNCQKKSWISVTLPLSILTFPRKFVNHGTIGRMSMKNYYRYVISASLYFEWTFSLSLWSSVISSLTNCYWTASLQRNTEWSGQETTSWGKFYNNLVTFGLLNIIYLPTKSSQKFKSLSWTKIVKRYK